MRSLRWTAAVVALVAMSSAAAAHSAADRKLSRNTETRALIPAMQDQNPYGLSDGHRHSANPNNDVHVGGIYIGSDPDPRIRLELIREYYQRQW